jgi:hypothetical protein
MSTLAALTTTVWRVEFPRLSPMFHPIRVKLPNREKGRNIERNNNSLSIFHPFTRMPPRGARPRVIACVRKAGGETVKLSIRYSPASASEEARGNSARSIQSLFRLSGFSERPPVATRWAVGERTRPRRTSLRSRRPGAPGRRFWAFGANPRAEDGPVNDDKEVTL